MEEKYKFFQNYFKETIIEDALISLAEEKYLVNKESYYKEEKRELSYISIIYNENNKQNNHLLAQNIMKNLKNKTLEFKDILGQYKDNETDIEVVNGINYYYNKIQQTFSEAAFESKTTGLIEKLLEINSRYIIIYITKISPKGYISFDEVKGTIIPMLNSAQIKRDSTKLILDLTQDEVKIDKVNLMSLRTRYSPSI
mgnify:CR=1 FL=1